jgi:hypothetical protein
VDIESSLCDKDLKRFLVLRWVVGVDGFFVILLRGLDNKIVVLIVYT